MGCVALNASYEPLMMLPVRRVLRLVVYRKANQYGLTRLWHGRPSHIGRLQQYADLESRRRANSLLMDSELPPAAAWWSGDRP